MFKQSRGLWITAILALLAMGCGFAGIAGVLNVTIVGLNGMDARDWVKLGMAIAWLLVIGGGLTLFGVVFVWLTRALDKAERVLLNKDSKRKP